MKYCGVLLINNRISNLQLSPQFLPTQGLCHCQLYENILLAEWALLAWKHLCFVSLWKLSALCLCLLIRLFSVGSLIPAFVIPPFLPLSRNKWGIKTESSGTEDRDGREARRWQQLTGNHRMDLFCLQDLKSTRLEHSSSAFCYVPVPVGCNVK